MSHPRLSLWPGLPPVIYLRRRRGKLPYPLGDPGCRIYSWGRHGLWKGVRELGIVEGDEVLMPAYHHGSEVEALRRAGMRVVYFDPTPLLEPDPAVLAGLITPRTRALHLIHYYGFPQDVSAWRQWCDERDLLLFEDVAQSWMATSGGAPVGSRGDLAIYSPYKSYGLPHVGLLRSRSSGSGPGGPPVRGGPGEVLRLHAKWAMGRWGSVAAAATPFERRRRTVIRDDQALGDPDEGPPRGIQRLLPRVVDPRGAKVRRAHYARLLRELGDLVPAPFDRLPDGAVPLVFPIMPGNRDEVLERLDGQRILARTFWPQPHPSVEPERFPVATSWREGLVTLPVHQELRARDLAWMVRAVRRVATPRRVSAPDALARTAPSPRFGAGTPNGGAPHAGGPAIEFVDELDALREPWTRLAEESRNVFGTWEWASIWWRHFGGKGRLCVGVCRDTSGEAVAILPLYRARRNGLRLVRFLGHGPGDEIGPIIGKGAREDAGSLLARAIRQLPSRWDLVLGEQVPGDVDWTDALGARILQTEGSPRISIGGRSWDEFLAGLGRKLRQEIRHDERKMAREHELRFRLSEPGDLDVDLDRLFSLHATRWPTSEFASQRAFHMEFLRLASERGWLRLWFLELDGAPAAVAYGMRFAGVDAYYQGGWDRAWSRSSVGTIIVAHTIRDAFESEMVEYRFLRGDESYKYRFAPQDPRLITFALSRGAAGRAAMALATIGGRSSLRAARRRLLPA